MKAALPAVAGIILALMLRGSFAAEAESLAVDLLFVGDDALFVVRLNLKADGRSLTTAWERSARELFGLLDANGDESLAGDELARVPLPVELMSLTLGEAAPAGVITADFDQKDGRVLFVEFAEYLRRCGAGPVRVLPSQVVGAAQMNAPRPIDLAGRMDLDGDEQLSQREFAVGLVQLRKLDFDDDQSLSPAELQPFGAAQARPPTRPDSSMSVEIVSLTRRVSGYSLAQRLLARYDKQGDSEKQAANQQLGRTEIPLSAAAFAEADADDSGRLDFDELVLWTRQPHTSATLAIDIGLGETAKPRMKLGPTDAESSLRLRATSGTLTVGKSAIELALNGAAPLMNSAGAEFTAADADSNGYLDADEADRAYPGLMRLIDANRDGQVFREEWNHVQRVHLLLTQARVVISVEREDANLFDKLDLNGDARLDFIELREALDRAADWDGAVTPGEVSHQIRMTLRTGAAITGSQQLQQSPRIPALAPQSRAAGWFERMDQNQDGQVARREFLGTSALFAQLDRDRSGRLTPHEARLQPGNPHSGPQQSENRHVVIR